MFALLSPFHTLEQRKDCICLLRGYWTVVILFSNWRWIRFCDVQLFKVSDLELSVLCTWQFSTTLFLLCLETCIILLYMHLRIC